MGYCKVVNKGTEHFDVYIGRGSKWGNPYTHKDGTKALHKLDNLDSAIESYRDYITKGEGKWLLDHLNELEGKILGCYCKPKPCHGDILVELVNQNLLNDMIGKYE